MGGAPFAPHFGFTWYAVCQFLFRYFIVGNVEHFQLMKIDDEWKVIEIGARMGGFRNLLHKLSCDIEHSLNDV